jgi:carboxyl-terminal processing protease
MISIPRLSRLGIIALTVVLSASLGFADGDHKFKSNPTLQTEAATMIKLFELYHFSRTTVHSSDYAEVVPDYMQALDGQHLFFLGVDKTYYTTKYNGATVYSKVAYNGDIDPAYEIFETYQKRVKERITWIYGVLKTPMDLKSNDTYAPDRTKAEWPATAPDSDDLWRRRLKYELIAELLSQKDEKADNKEIALSNKDTTKALDKTKVVQTLKDADKKEVTSAASVVQVTINQTMGTDIVSKKDEAKTNDAKTDVAKVSTPKLTPQEQAIETVRKRYERMLKNLDDIESGDLAELYLTSIASLYDPHSNYFSADSYDEFSISMKLQLFGIGAMLRLKDDYCTIEELVPGGPADLGHQLKPGDKIIAVAQDGKPSVDIIGMKLRKIVDMIRGAKGTKVHLMIEPGSATASSGKKEVVIVRDVVKIDSARAHGALFQVPDKTGKIVPLGVITLPEFYGPADDASSHGDITSASKDTAKLLKQLTDAGAQGIVLDLRHNGGGFLAEAINLAGLFIPSGPIVQVVDSSGEKQVDNSEQKTVAYSGPLAVLTDRFSASASEIVTGALQNYGRAIVIGDQSTHGKGTVQQVLDMKNLTKELHESKDKTGATKITIQKFYLPNGSSTQLNGVVPDIVLPSINQFMPIGESSLPHALIWDRTAAAPNFKGHLLDQKIVDQLIMASRVRQSSLPEFSLLKKNVDWFKMRQNEKLVRLSIDERKQEKDADDKFTKAIKKERDSLAKADYTHKEFWVAPPPPKKIKVKSDDPEDDLNSEDEDQSYPKMDIYLRETFRILDDAIGMKRDPSLWVSNHPPLTLAANPSGK